MIRLLIAILLVICRPVPYRANDCDLSGADRVEVLRYDGDWRFSDDITDEEWMNVPTTWEATQPWEEVIHLYRYEAKPYAWVVYYADATPLHYIDVKIGDGVLYAIVLPASRGGHGCTIVADDLDGYVETWLDYASQ